MSIAIDVKGLDKSFGGRRVVKDFSIQVEQGRITGFLGPNGSGKTTTLRMLCGLLTPDKGEGEALGFDIIDQAWEVKRRTGYMTQRFSLYEDLTVQENLEFSARIRGLDRRRQRVESALEDLGLAERRKQLSGTLSGGWKQRLALAVATLHEPQLLLLDEPTAGVDPQARRTFWDEIHALAAKGLTVLVSTHYMDEAERCHDIAYLAYGQLLARGTADEVIAAAGLSTWRGEGPGVHGLTGKLLDDPAIEMATPFGLALHVSGADPRGLEQALERHRHPPFKWTRSEPTLEDVFIHLMSRAEDNFQ